MQVYFAYDKETGKIVHMHRAVDTSGQCSTCTTDDVLRVLPANINPETVGVTSATIDQMLSSRQRSLQVNVETGELIQSAVATD